MVDPGSLAKHLGGHDGGGQRARQQLAFVVDQEDPIGIAVEGQADVGSGVEHAGLEVDGGSRVGSGRPDGSGRCRRARRTAARTRRAGRRTRRERRVRPCRWPCRPRCAAASGASMSTKPWTWATKSPRASSWLTVPTWSTGSTPRWVASRITSSPLSSPIGRAPARHILIPLYCAGLCDAVSVAPGAAKWPAAKNSRSVEARPRSTTSRPWLVTPRAKAADSSTPDGRMSRASTTRPAVSASVFTKAAKAAPMRSTRAASSWSGTVPRTS